MPASPLRLGVNIDHVATVRNARGGRHPDPVRAALLAIEAGADGITAHLREDRRHITDADIEGLQEVLNVPLNFEMAATEEMQAIALRHKPHAVCIVPEKREERTTEGGLEVAREENRLAHFIAPLREAGCRVSIFIAADRRQIEAAHRIGAQVIELHTGAYCDAHAEGRFEDRDREMTAIRDMAEHAAGLGLEVRSVELLEEGEANYWAATQASCRLFELFRQIATAAGPDLTNESFAMAAADLGSFSISGQPYNSLGPDKFDARDTLSLAEWDHGLGFWRAISDPVDVG